MNAEMLLKKVIECGADEAGIKDRFGDNAALYEMCFRDFFDEPNFEALRVAVGERNYEQAFEAAHALKGLSGNLGLTEIYNAISALVESLRAGDYGNVDAEYARVCAQQQRLAEALGEREKPDTEPDTEPRESDTKGKRKKDRYIRLSILVIFAVLLIVCLLFFQISVNYRKTMITESGQHLTEMCNQTRLYIEEQVSNDWRVALSVGDNMKDCDYSDDSAILSMLRRKQQVWGVSDLMLYTENGFCVYADGSTVSNDIASDTVARARELGKYLSVIDSRIIYTVPVETQVQYGGSEIAAVSVVQDMKTFLDDMNFASFNEEAWMYLTDENGIVISTLTSKYAVPVFNFMAIAERMHISPLDENRSEEDLLRAENSSVFLMSDDTRSDYVVSVPISTDGSPLRLFYLASEASVNSTMNAFSQRLTGFSMTTIGLFAVFAFLAFLLIYRSRKRTFDKQIMARERMFDLLVNNTQTAFGLFRVNSEKPTYISSNAANVIGDRYWAIDKEPEGYCLRNDTLTRPDTIRQANEMIRDWDGKSAFKSGYICSGHTVPPSYFELQLYPVGGDGMDFVGIAQNVTQAFERENATKNAMEMATRSNEAKSRFLSNMSHDIRTPMNAIMNMTNFALESVDNPKKLGPYLHTIRESSEHLLHLINDVLDMSRIESGQTAVASEPFDICTEVKRQVDMIRPLCEAKGQTLIADFSAVRTQSVLGDALKLSQIIMNLLSNAVKFTPEKGAVRFTAEEIPSLRDDIVDIRFTVEDNGIGIPSEDLPHIFEPFSRANDKRVSRIEGTGLGLSICKSYVDAMGGAIRCESEAGEGSTFTVELFFQVSDTQQKEESDIYGAGEIPFLGLRCLVVEDNPTNQLIAKSLLERLGFMTDFADDGREGVQKFLSSKPDAYDVIYMDIQMPVLDGYQATSRIRQSRHPRAKTIPIVAMTANVFAEDVEKARTAGMDAYLGKPILSFDLIEQTVKAIRKKRGES